MTARGFMLGIALGICGWWGLPFSAGAQGLPADVPTLLCVGSGHPGTRSATRDLKLVEQKDDFAEQLVQTCTRMMEQNGYDASFLHVSTPTAGQAEVLLRDLAPGSDPASFVGLVATDRAGHPQRVLFNLPHAEQMGLQQAADAVYARWSTLLMFVKQPHDFQVTLRGRKGQFVSPSDRGKFPLECKSSAPEVFTLTDYNGLLLRSGDPITLRSSKNLLVSAEDGGGQKIDVNRTEKGAWETLTIRKMGPDSSPVIHSGDQVAIQSMKQTWFSARHGGGSSVQATSRAIGSWETFVIEIRTGMSTLPK